MIDFSLCDPLNCKGPSTPEAIAAFNVMSVETARKLMSIYSKRCDRSQISNHNTSLIRNVETLWEKLNKLTEISNLTHRDDFKLFAHKLMNCHYAVIVFNAQKTLELAHEAFPLYVKISKQVKISKKFRN